jgi:hypothetical protein
LYSKEERRDTQSLYSVFLDKALKPLYSHFESDGTANRKDSFLTGCCTGCFADEEKNSSQLVLE